MKLPSIAFTKEALSRFEESIQKEWLITNGLGGYASSTVLGINTRKYHGLLVAALHPPGDRRVFLSNLNEEVCLESSTYPLGANEFRNEVFPKGYGFLKEFSVSPFPKYTYAVQGLGVQKTVFMPHDRNAAVILYKISNKNRVDAKIRIFPLINWRPFHSVTDRWKIAAEPVQKCENREVLMNFNPSSSLRLRASDGQYFAKEKWVEKIFYRAEADRGESSEEDCFQSGWFEIEAKADKNTEFGLVAVADENEDRVRQVAVEIPETYYDLEGLYEKERNRHENALTSFYETHANLPADNWLKWLALATDVFVVKRAEPEREDVIAGYHWFETWARDTFISLPGLMLVTSRFKEARETFLAFREYCKQGLIPNFMPDSAGSPAYNAVDASLWYVNAVLQYLKYTGDFGFVREKLWKTFESIIESYLGGTLFSIHMDGEGLLSHGSQLTWMDAVVDGQPVTARTGRAVEVQALWYNALRTMNMLAKNFNENSKAEKYLQMAEKTKKSFVGKFWNPERECLFDVVDMDLKDTSLRPNQIIAVALDFTMLDNIKNERVVDFVQSEFLTPYGLRTLARVDPRYVGIYVSDRGSRDRAYHNGTVWPWLLGSFVTAYLKSKGYTDFRREIAMHFLLPFFTEQVFKAGLGFMSEVFDGEPPHATRGCIAQAWSVAEPFRAYMEDVKQFRPKFEKEILGI